MKGDVLDGSNSRVEQFLEIVEIRKPKKDNKKKPQTLT